MWREVQRPRVRRDIIGWIAVAALVSEILAYEVFILILAGGA